MQNTRSSVSRIHRMVRSSRGTARAGRHPLGSDTPSLRVLPLGVSRREEIPRRVLVPVVERPAWLDADASLKLDKRRRPVRTPPLPDGERQALKDMAARVTPLGRREEAVDLDQGLVVPAALVLEQAHELAEGSIRQRAGQAVLKPAQARFAPLPPRNCGSPH